MVNTLKLYQGILPSTETTLYTQAPSGQLTDITEVIVTNNTALAATFSLSVVTAGNVPGNANRIFDATSVAANAEATYEFTGEPLGPGDFISGMQATANAIDITINGVLVT